MTNSTNSLAVVIPTKNRPDDLAITIGSVLTQTALPKQLIVIDQSSTDESQRRVRTELRRARAEVRNSIELIYVHDPSISGGASARNCALNNSRSDFVLFLDDDVVLEDNFIDEILRVYGDNSHVGGVSGVVTNYTSPSMAFQIWLRTFTRGPFWDDRQPVYWHADHLRDCGPIKVTRFGAGLMSFRAGAIEGLRFDENLRGVSDGEDVDFCARIKPGTLLLIAPRARLVHNQSPVGRSREHWLTRHARTMWYLYLRNWNHGARNRLCFLWLNVGYVLTSVLVSIRRGSLESCAGVVKAIRDSRELVQPSRAVQDQRGIQILDRESK